MFAEKNSIYLIAAYVVFLGSIFIYLLSLVIRIRNLKRDEQLLQEITEQMKQEEPGIDESARPQMEEVIHPR
jgi:hypothetical protein